MYLSEIVSDLTEPMVGAIIGEYDLMVCGTCIGEADCECPSVKEGVKMVTWRKMKNTRRCEWVKKVYWKEGGSLTGETGIENNLEDNLELDRSLHCSEANREDIQNFEVPMVFVGCDVSGGTG